MGEKGAYAGSRSAQELLAEFQQTGQEAPFAEIARRYAGMVYNVALRVTRDAHDAEDATQATFLTLAVHAKTTGQIRYVGPWLKKVSHRLALDIRRSKKRRSAREQRHAANGNGSNGNGHQTPVSNGLDVEELRHILREEIDKLPAKYRLPLILYYFGGLSPDEIGSELRCNTSTLGVRLHRGRKLLAESLRRRGVSVTAAVVAGALAGLVDSSVKDNLVLYAANAARTATHIAAHGMAADAAFSAHVLGLMRSASAALRWGRFKAVVAASVLIATTLAGATEVLQRYDVLNSSVLQQLDPMRWLQPLIDHLKRPALQVKVDPPESLPIQSAKAIPPEIKIPVLDWPTELAPLQAIAGIPGSSASPAAPSPPSASERAIARGGASTPASRSAAPLSQFTQSEPAQQNAPVARQQPGAANLAAASSKSVPEPVPATSARSAPPVAGTLIVDRASSAWDGKTDPGSLMIGMGLTRAQRLIVGDSTTGTVSQTGGEVRLEAELLIASKAGSSGAYSIGGTGQLQAPVATVGGSGNGSFVQSGGNVSVTTTDHQGALIVAKDPGSSGSYIMKDGALQADTIVVGQQGQGTFSQEGGTTSFIVAQLGQEPLGKGVLSVSDGVLEVSKPQAPGDAAAPPLLGPVAAAIGIAPEASPTPPVTAQLTPAIVVGGNGAGTVVLQSSAPNGVAIQEQASAAGAALMVRSSFTGDGTLRGWGSVQITGELVENGRVIADGKGSRRALDFSTASRVVNTIENPPSGTNGWYARNGGSVILPPISIEGSRFYTWGEDPFDNLIDLVNSVRVKPWIPDGEAGTMDISLLDPRNSDAPPLPVGVSPLGLWSLASTVSMDGMNLLIRYDDELTRDKGAAERDIGLWVYEGNWVEVPGDLSGVNIFNNLLWGKVAGDPTFFAAAVGQAAAGATLGAPLPAAVGSSQGVPEPSGLLWVAVANAGVLLRRRKV